MKIKLDRLSKDMVITGVDPGTSVTVNLEGEALVADVNKKGCVTFNIGKYIDKHQRKDITIDFKKKGSNDIQTIVEVRQTKLLLKATKEIVKEKK